MKNIVWLASYPKSGNTWMRAFISSLLRNKKINEPVIQELVAPIMSHRGIIENELCVETSELTQEELEELQPIAWKSAVKGLQAPFFLKVHDAYTYTKNGSSLIPAEESIGAVYIVRNPLDVAVSFSHYRNNTVDDTINAMSDSGFRLAKIDTGLHMQVEQKLLSWSDHVRSWLSQKDIPVLLVRYEDMLAQPQDAFARVADFCGIKYTPQSLLTAIENTSFDNLKKQELAYGYKGKNPAMDFFFRKGKVNGWIDELIDVQVSRIITAHGDVMRELGYLDDWNNLLN